MKKLLIIRFSSMGDVAMLACILKEFIKKYPQIKIYVISKYYNSDIFKYIKNIYFISIYSENYKGVKGIHRLYKELYQYKFNYIADMHNNLRSNILTFLFKLNTNIPIKTLNKGTVIKIKNILLKNKNYLKPTSERYADVLRKLGFKIKLNHCINNSIKNKINNSIGVAPFAKYIDKIYPIEKTKIIIEKLVNDNFKIYLFGGGYNEIQELKTWIGKNIILVSGKYSLYEELKIMEKLEFMISMDSSNMHLASLTNTINFSIWGITHPCIGFIGYGQSIKNIIHNDNLKYRPNSIYGKKYMFYKKRDYFKNLSTDLVYKQIKERMLFYKNS